MTLKTALLLIGGLTLITGLVIGIILVSQRQLINKKASVPSGGSSDITISPSTANIAVGNTTTVNVALNTNNTSVTGYQLVASYSYTGTTAPVDIVDNSGNPATQVTPITDHFDTKIGGVNGNEIIRTSGKTTIQIAYGINGSSYSTQGQAVNIFSFNLKGITAGESIILHFDAQNSSVPNSSNLESLNAPADSTYTVVAPAGGTTPSVTPTPSPTTVPGTTPSVTSTPAPSPSPTTPPAGGATPTTTITPTSAPSANSCGGTCGSNANCTSDLFCDTTSGTCRNALCPVSSNCVCSQANASTPVPTAVTVLTKSGSVSSTLVISGIGLLLVLVSGVLLF